MSKPDPPQPPNPFATAAAQTGTNVSTAVANAYLSNYNQNTPEGSLNWSESGSHQWTDPSTGQTYTIPTFTSTQSLNQQGQAIKDQTDATKLQLAQMGNQQAGRVSGLLGTPFNPNANAPAAGNASTISGAPKALTSYDAGGAIQKNLGNYGQQQSTFGDAGAITKTYGTGGDITKSYGAGDFSADRNKVEESLMARLNPQLQKERANIEQRLADQGIRYGSQAYTSAMDDYNRQATDTRFGAVSQAGQEQQRMMDMAAQRAGFQNAAQQQAYGQNAQLAGFQNAAQGQAYQQAMGRGEFANNAQMQNYQQALGAGSFANAAQQQQNAQNASQAGFYNAGAGQQLAQAQSGFNAANAARNQSMQEQYQQRNQPLNEISALMSGSQLQNPNWLNTPQSQIPTTDIGGLINQNFAQQSQNYQSANQNWQSTMGGILGLGGKLGAAAIMSDERVKENIVPMGTVFAAGDDGERKKLPISEWSYKGDPARHVGPMAQDVERIDPKAVKKIGGIRHIDPRRVMGGILRAA